MKKISYIILLLLFMVFPSHIEAKEYNVSGTDVSINIDDSKWIVFTRDNLYNNPELDELGLTYQFMNDFMTTNNIYLNAIKLNNFQTKENLEFNIRVNDLSTKVANLHTYPTEEINEFGKEIINSGKINANNFTIYGSEYKYIEIEYIDKGYNVYQFYTVINGRGYNFTAQKENAITFLEKNQIKGMIDTIIFELDSNYEQPTKSFSIKEVIKTAIIGGIIGGLCGLVYAIIYKKKKGNKSTSKTNAEASNNMYNNNINNIIYNNQPTTNVNDSMNSAINSIPMDTSINNQVNSTIMMNANNKEDQNIPNQVLPQAFGSVPNNIEQNMTTQKHYGWDDISKTFNNLYPNQEPKHYGALIKYSLGGNDPLDGVSIYDGGSYYHFVTYGFSEIYEKQSTNPNISGFGFELTLKLKKDNNIDENELKNVVSLLQTLARYVHSTKKAFKPYEYIYTGTSEGIDSNHKSQIVGFVTIEDHMARSIDSVNGKIQFIELIGATNTEISLILNKEKTKEEVINTIINNYGDITNYNR